MLATDNPDGRKLLLRVFLIYVSTGLDPTDAVEEIHRIVDSFARNLNDPIQDFLDVARFAGESGQDA